jgi:serine protease Do
LKALGMSVRDLDRDSEAEGELRGGVVVTEVAINSAAYEAGVREGDVITRFGRKAISRLADMEIALDGIESGDSVSLRLIRQGAPLFIGIKVPEND